MNFNGYKYGFQHAVRYSINSNFVFIDSKITPAYCVDWVSVQTESNMYTIKKLVELLIEVLLLTSTEYLLVSVNGMKQSIFWPWQERTRQY